MRLGKLAASVLHSPKVASTATSSPLQEMFVLEHPETTVRQNETHNRKAKKRKEKRRVSRAEGHSVEKERVGSTGRV